MNEPACISTINRLKVRIAELRNYVSQLADIAQNNDIGQDEWDAIEQIKAIALSANDSPNSLTADELRDSALHGRGGMVSPHP